MQTVKEAAGGADGLLCQANAWHARVMADEVVSHASAADRQAAVTVATLIQNSGIWYVFGAISLIGESLGFILLGCALWRAGTVPRWAAACISLGPLIHIAGGDIWWTATGGILLLALGLGILARVQLATIMAVKVRRTAHPVLVAGRAQRAGSRLS